MVRRPEWTLRQKSSALGQGARDAVDPRRLQPFLEGERRQVPGHALGEHRLARPRRTDHQHVVRSGGSHFKRPFGDRLSAHIPEVGSDAPPAWSRPGAGRAGLVLGDTSSGLTGTEIGRYLLECQIADPSPGGSGGGGHVA